MFNSKYRYFDPRPLLDCFWRYNIQRDTFEVSYKNKYGWINSKIPDIKFFKRCDEISHLQAAEKYPEAFQIDSLTGLIRMNLS